MGKGYNMKIPGTSNKALMVEDPTELLAEITKNESIKIYYSENDWVFFLHFFNKATFKDPIKWLSILKQYITFEEYQEKELMRRIEKRYLVRKDKAVLLVKKEDVFGEQPSTEVTQIRSIEMAQPITTKKELHVNVRFNCPCCEVPIIIELTKNMDEIKGSKEGSKG